MNYSKVFFLKLFYVLTIFISSSLLFLIQPITGKYILPYLGGNASVWTTTMIFYISFLFFGYLYAFLLTKVFSPNKQAFVHVTILIVSLAYLLLRYLGDGNAVFNINQSALSLFAPISSIIFFLLSSVGVPYLILSSTSTVLQKWISEIDKKHSPYMLYVFSNIGSLFSLLIYPFVFEYFFSLNFMVMLWFFFYLIYSLFFIICSWLYLKNSNTYQAKQIIRPDIIKNKPGIKSVVLWTILPMSASMLLLTVTNQISQNISPTPFIWLMPLIIYLLSYVFAFKQSGLENKTIIYLVLIVLSFTTYFFAETYIHNWFRPITLTAYLFVFCYLAHRRLYNSRPESPHQLPDFYLFSSLGSVVGSILVGIIFPSIFADYWEFNILIYISLFTGLKAVFSKIHVSTTRKVAVGVFFLMIILFLAFIKNRKAAIVAQKRNFFGVNKIMLTKIKPNINMVLLINGEIQHGYQLTGKNMPTIPTLYYDHKSGVGILINYLNQKLNRPIKIGAIGLGAGTISAYCKTGDLYRFFEINPVVIDWSTKYFSYINYCRSQKGTVEIVEGDGRIMLTKEIDNIKAVPTYDLIVIDAFNDDSIPAHLLTKEAIDIYLKRLNKGGYIAFHISNKSLDLKPVLKRVAQFYKINAKYVKSLNASWIILSDSDIPIGVPFVTKNVTLWTDNYSSILPIIKL